MENFQMFPLRITRVWKFIVGLMLLVFIALSLIPARGVSAEGAMRMAYERGMKVCCAHVVSGISDDGGCFSRECLSDYIPPDVFASSSLGIPHPKSMEWYRPHEWWNSRRLFDIYSDYVLPRNRNVGILLHERPGLWRDGTIAVCFSKSVSAAACPTGKKMITRKLSPEFGLIILRMPVDELRQMMEPENQ